MSTPFRYDWLGSLSRIQEAGEDPASFCLYCLPVAGVKLLGALLERARWRATYKDEHGEFPLSDEEWQFLTDIVDDTEVGLMANCDSIIANIVTQVTTNVQQTIVYNNAYDDTCCFTENLPGQPLSEEPPADTEPGGGTESGARCARAQQGMEGGYELLHQLLVYAAAGGSVTAGFITTLLLASLNPVTLPLALLGGIAVAIVALVSQQVEENEILLQWESLRHPIACCMAWSATAQDAKECIDGEIDSVVENSIVAGLFKLFWSQAAVNDIWDGTNGFDGVGFSNTYCNDCITGEWVGIRWRITAWYSDISNTNVGFGWVSVTADDIVNGEGRVNSDVLNVTTPQEVVLYDTTEVSDITAAPEYSSAWNINVGSSGFHHAPSEPTIRLGVRNNTGANHVCSATATGFQVLIKKLDGTLLWLPATITAEDVDEAFITVTPTSMQWAEQEYEPDTSERQNEGTVSVSYTPI